MQQVGDIPSNPLTLRKESGSLNELRVIKPESNRIKLPPMKNSASAKQIRLAYTVNTSTITNPFEMEENVVKKDNVEELNKLKKFAGGPKSNHPYLASTPHIQPIFAYKAQNNETTGPIRRRRGLPKTQFKIPKSNTNIERLEQVIVEYIEKNKTLKSSNDDLLLRPQNKIQASLSSLKVINRILPNKNIVYRRFGYDEDNLDKNHLTLEKIMLERMEKLKKRREQQKLIKEKERKNVEGSIISNKVEN